MPIRSGLSNQVGFIKDATYGTTQAPTKFLPCGSAKFQLDQTFVQGQGLYSGDLGPRASQNVLTVSSGEGTIDMDILNKDMGTFAMMLMGTTVTPVIQGAGPAYLQTHTLADPFGKSMTLQSGVTQITDGVTKPYTLLGAKVLAGEFTFTPADIAKVTWTIDAKDCVETTALAFVSYSTNLVPYSIGQGATGITVKTGTFASETLLDGVTQATCKIDRKSKDDRIYLGALGKKSEPILNDVVDVITGTLSMDFLDKTKVADLYAAGTTTSLVMECVGPIINASFPYTFRITVPSVKFTGTTPQVDGPDVINGDFPWIWVYDGTNLPKIEIIELATTL